MTTGLVSAWSDFGRRMAVLAGMGVALISVANDCPLWVASARGAGTIVGLALIVELIARLLAWSSAGDRAERLARVAAANERGRNGSKERK